MTEQTQGAAISAQPTLFPNVPELIEGMIGLGANRRLRCRGFADKQHVDIVLIDEHDRETLVQQLDLADANNVLWLITTCVRRLEAANAAWRRLHRERNRCCGNVGTHGEGGREFCSSCGQEQS